MRTNTTGEKIARSVVATTVSQAVVFALLFVASISQARLVGAEGRGEIARFVNFSGLVVLYFGLGIASAITYFIASGRATASALLIVLRPWFLITSAAAAVAILGASLSAFGRLLPHEAATQWVVIGLSLYFMLSQAGSWLGAVLAARTRFAILNVSSVIVAATAATISAALLVLRPVWATPWTIIGLFVALEAVRVGTYAVVLFRSRSARAPNHDTREALVPVGQLVRYSGLAFAADAIQFLIYRLDMWIVDAFRGASELGRYALAVSLAQLVWIVPAATARVIFPYAPALRGLDGARLVWRAARLAILVAALVGLAGWLLSQSLVVYLFGSDFATVPELIGILLIGIIPFAGALVMGNYLSGTQSVGFNAASSIVILVVALLLDLLLIPTMGATGAAWATAVSYSLHTGLLMWIFARRTGLPFRTLLWRSRDQPTDP